MTLARPVRSGTGADGDASQRTGRAGRERSAASGADGKRIPGRAPRPAPTFDMEIALARELPGPGPHVVVGLDEVGRGCLAGPVTVGACAIRVSGGHVDSDLPEQVRDSKLLSPARREELAPMVRASSHAHGIGWASAAEIDRIGIMAALSLAARRALAELRVPVDAILLDGNVDLLADRYGPSPVLPGTGDVADGPVPGRTPRVRTRVGADRDCRSVAAASVIAKVARDAHMVALHAEAPQYDWAANKGYGSAAHREAITRIGVHPEHRQSWALVGGGATSAGQPTATVDAAAPQSPLEERAERVTGDRAPDARPLVPAVLWEDRPPRSGPTSPSGEDAP